LGNIVDGWENLGDCGVDGGEREDSCVGISILNSTFPLHTKKERITSKHNKM
jgi:hypothetical protein